ncbi:DotD/TraH family lipoprotein [Kozakia baliensis]|uniref:Secretion protein n=1 Tax=Kozakia baliensis TaxID=153496 RepID=A0A1D8UXM3_9PROT|nr:DotD/TraH family lipoprotein [Kozakia baliensis]AOX18413.1 secretion protein [Kozakia baliensis]GBR34089.1 secretion system type IV protein DotD [Kozakia baliensis NRIC 0488]GEL65146.1 hypothetical protein KBA01_24320 [Kozakia baliensis]
MKPFLLTAPALFLALAACSGHVPDPGPVDTSGMPSPELALQRAVASTTSDLRELGTMRAPQPVSVSAEAQTPDDVNRKLWFAWNGPLDGAVKKLGKAIGYTVTIFGSSHPIKVTTNSVAPALDILRSLGEQAGTGAAVQVDTLHHQIAVVYNA